MLFSNVGGMDKTLASSLLDEIMDSIFLVLCFFAKTLSLLRTKYMWRLPDYHKRFAGSRKTWKIRSSICFDPMKKRVRYQSRGYVLKTEREEKH
jgi:hypothetical protein